MRQEHDWLINTNDIHKTDRDCGKPAKNRVGIKRNQSDKTVPQQDPLRFITMNSLGQRSKTTIGNKFIKFLNDRHMKLHWAITQSKPIAPLALFTFFNFRTVSSLIPTFCYRIGQSTVSKQVGWGVVYFPWGEPLDNTRYHSQTNCSTESSNITIITWFPNYVSGHQCH